MKNYYKKEIATQMINKYNKGVKSITLHQFDFNLFWNGTFAEREVFYDAARELKEMGFVEYKSYYPKTYSGKRSCKITIVEEKAKEFAESFGFNLK